MGTKTLQEDGVYGGGGLKTGKKERETVITEGEDG